MVVSKALAAKGLTQIVHDDDDDDGTCGRYTFAAGVVAVLHGLHGHSGVHMIC